MSESTTSTPAATPQPPMVTLTVDGKTVTVPKGTNLIDAAKAAGVDVPYYCYHPHLSIAGNCRMCQVEVKGQPKLTIGCNTVVAPNMEVLTQNTSKTVEDAQAATLEFILINHPLDCTVCDQAGHCKLQDYHYEYNARPSRLLEEKVHKVKAEPLGPHVILDGERCIMCTRCVRFCDEITKTSELGLLNRGDKTVIAINQDRPLDNALSGTVVDLCPVGALTHRDWRFNTRIWFTKETESICPGCSTGCNTRVAVRDGAVVQVKARLNSEVNKEWMCDEGRYGFMRFLPQERITAPRIDGKVVTLEQALAEASKIKNQSALVMVSPDLLLEEYVVLKKFVEKYLKGAQVVLAYKERPLTEVEKILVSPDYSANFRAAEYSGVLSEATGMSRERLYRDALTKIKQGSVGALLLVGERAIFPEDCDNEIIKAVSGAWISVALAHDAAGKLAAATKVILPGRSILEKSGLMVNRKNRLQYSDAVIDFPEGTEPEWRLLNSLAIKCGGTEIVPATADRELTNNLLATDPRLAGLKISTIKAGGVQLSPSSEAVEATLGTSAVA